MVRGMRAFQGIYQSRCRSLRCTWRWSERDDPIGVCVSGTSECGRRGSSRARRRWPRRRGEIGSPCPRRRRRNRDRDARVVRRRDARGRRAVVANRYRRARVAYRSGAVRGRANPDRQLRRYRRRCWNDAIARAGVRRASVLGKHLCAAGDRRRSAIRGRLPHAPGAGAVRRYREWTIWTSRRSIWHQRS